MGWLFFFFLEGFGWLWVFFFGYKQAALISFGKVVLEEFHTPFTCHVQLTFVLWHTSFWDVARFQNQSRNRHPYKPSLNSNCLDTLMWAFLRNKVFWVMKQIMLRKSNQSSFHAMKARSWKAAWSSSPRLRFWFPFFKEGHAHVAFQSSKSFQITFHLAWGAWDVFSRDLSHK